MEIDYLQKLFINEAKPALQRHSGGGDTQAAYQNGVAAGIEKGKTDAYGEIQDLNAELEQTLYGTDTGGKSYYDEFWGENLNEGKRRNFNYAYAYYGWTDKSYNPPHSLIATSGCVGMFVNNSFITDTKVPIDFSGTYLNQTFSHAAALKRIAPITVNENTTYNLAFSNCDSLVNLTIVGVIGQNGLNVQWSPLSHASLMSIINALKDNSGTENWNEIVLGSDNIAKLTQEERAIMDTKQWIYT